MFKRIYNWLDSHFTCESRIRNSANELDKITQLKSDKAALKAEVELTKKELEETIRRLANVVWAPDDSLHAPKPFWLVSGASYIPKKRLDTKSNGIRTIFLDQRDYYAPFQSLIDIVKKTVWHNLKHDEKLLAIWGWVIMAINYEFDNDEDWRFAPETLQLKFGDCEDGTILFISLCRLVGISADSIFNACGWFTQPNGSRFGHSYPIAKMSDGKWYVFETTIDFIPKAPKRFLGSNYTADWGVSNWVHVGGIKNGNGKATYQL